MSSDHHWQHSPLVGTLSTHIPSISDSAVICSSKNYLHNVLRNLYISDNKMKVLTVLAICLSAALAENIKIGDLSSLQHGVSGEVYAADDNTIVLENFKYDGAGETRLLLISPN